MFSNITHPMNMYFIFPHSNAFCTLCKPLWNISCSIFRFKNLTYIPEKYSIQLSEHIIYLQNHSTMRVTTSNLNKNIYTRYN